MDGCGVRIDDSGVEQYRGFENASVQDDPNLGNDNNEFES